MGLETILLFLSRTRICWPSSGGIPDPFDVTGLRVEKDSETQNRMCLRNSCVWQLLYPPRPGQRRIVLARIVRFQSVCLGSRACFFFSLDTVLQYPRGNPEEFSHLNRISWASEVIRQDICPFNLLNPEQIAFLTRLSWTLLKPHAGLLRNVLLYRSRMIRFRIVLYQCILLNALWFL